MNRRQEPISAYLRNMYDKQAIIWTDHEKWYECSDSVWNYLHNSRFKTVIKILDSFFKKKLPSNVLDIGCGEGIYFNYFAHALKKVPKIYGVDISSVRIMRAKNRWSSVHLIVCDAQYLPFKDNCFNFVLCSEVIEHLPNPIMLLKEINRVCRGYILLTTPSKRSSVEQRFYGKTVPLFSWNLSLDVLLSFPADFMLSVFSHNKSASHPQSRARPNEIINFELRYEHLNVFDPDDIQKLLEKMGFNVLNYEFSSLYLPFIPMRLMIKAHLMQYLAWFSRRFTPFKRYFWSQLLLIRTRS